MPEFGSPFSGLAKDRKVTHEELVRAIRFMIAAEYEAIQLYMQLAESTDHKLAQEVLKDIADDELDAAGNRQDEDLGDYTELWVNERDRQRQECGYD